MQPDITFFGEKLTDDFDDALKEDRDKVDLLIIIGTSLKVRQSFFVHASPYSTYSTIQVSPVADLISTVISSMSYATY